MRALVQRVSQAAVFVEGEKISSIKQGLLLFLGVVKGDSPAALQRMVHKVANLRIFSDQAGKMNLSVKDVAGEVLVVSQFTLAGELNKGFRPSFANAEEPLLAKEMYQQFCDALQEALAS
ncbi:MAG: D-tyrosyl-tRNA(Tyr) deacylase, partial [Magnetococcales bacterium]|nr:D-tyrosyl-tRNA(Tyr) deacylase [Magnetococcales bacterium]NGZ29427.1 D-tyrosyl-tRNA(Tyr) deacylase [Magnetococcales bacterium]